MDAFVPDTTLVLVPSLPSSSILYPVAPATPFHLTVTVLLVPAVCLILLLLTFSGVVTTWIGADVATYISFQLLSST